MTQERRSPEYKMMDHINVMNLLHEMETYITMPFRQVLKNVIYPIWKTNEKTQLRANVYDEALCGA